MVDTWTMEGMKRRTENRDKRPEIVVVIESRVSSGCRVTRDSHYLQTHFSRPRVSCPQKVALIDCKCTRNRPVRVCAAGTASHSLFPSTCCLRRWPAKSDQRSTIGRIRRQKRITKSEPFVSCTRASLTPSLPVTRMPKRRQFL